MIVASGVSLALRWESSPERTQQGANNDAEANRSKAEPVPTTGRQASANEILASGLLEPSNAETRLVEVFAFIEKGEFQTALQRVELLTQDHPNFHLAHLVRGDLLKLRYQPQAEVHASEKMALDGASARLAALRTETQARLSALRERPPSGHIPHQFLALSAATRHAVAIDASRSRLYLFENTSPAAGDPPLTRPPQLKLVGDFFISVGKSGINKRIEGDGRTPLGAYYITSVREKRTLPEFYGAGALPINYPNALDVQRGRTGSGIWLHGSPPDQFVRAPLASDGCVVLSNPDMERLLSTVAPRTTPVVIAEQLQWVPPSALAADAAAFHEVLSAWQQARSQATPEAFAQLFDTNAVTRVGLKTHSDKSEWLASPSVALGVANVSLLKWQDPDDNMVATFEETVDGKATGVIRRQYWTLRPQGWRLLQDTVLAGTPSAALKRPAAKPEPPTQVIAKAETTEESQPGKKTAPTSSPPPRDSARGEAAEVEQAVRAWAQAWSKKNMAQYLGAYAPSFAPPDGLSRKAWEQERRDRIVSKRSISVSLSNVSVKIQGTTATVGFVQHYKADQLAISSRKTLTLTQRGNRWLITRESVGGR